MVNLIHEILAINITMSRLFEVGVATDIVCSTVVPVQSIQWLAVDENMEVNSSMEVSVLELRLLVTSRHNNTRYRCSVSDGEFTESKDITISLGCKLSIKIVICWKCIMATCKKPNMTKIPLS